MTNWIEQEYECQISIHDQIDENVILQFQLAALNSQRQLQAQHQLNESITLEMLLKEKVLSKSIFVNDEIDLYEITVYF